MVCHAFGIVRCSPDELVVCLSRSSVKSSLSSVYHVRCHVPSKSIGTGFYNLARVHHISCDKYSPFHSLWRACSTPFGLEEQSKSGFSELQRHEIDTADPAEAQLAKPLSSDKLQAREDALINFKSELAVLELEIKALVGLADEIAKSHILEGSRKINGKYIHSHLVSRLEAVQQKLQDQIKDVAAAQSKEVSVFWLGMAESVQVMGSFDGWSQGEHLSPEYMGSYTLFSASLLLRPGRYEIKFLVDGEWKISPEYPTIGEGLTENNLLVVE